MKQKLYILGIFTTLLIFTGIVLKLNHLAGAMITITIGMASTFLLFLPAALVDNFKSEGTRQNLLLYIVTWITCFVVFLAALFKIGHWPLAGSLMTIALPFPYVVFLPVFLIVTSKNRNFNIYNTVFVLMLLVINSVFTGLLALNVSKTRVDQSFSLAGNYKAIEVIMDKLPAISTDNKVDKDADEVLKTIADYRAIILAQVKISPEQWRDNPETLLSPDSRGLAGQALLNSGDRPAGTRLFSSLKNLVAGLETTPEYSDLAVIAPAIFDMQVPSGFDEDWPSWKFNDNNLSWVLIYLDGLEANLKMIKAIPIAVKK
jgi:hypothetical protein